jgi:hypothetical protein
MKERRATYLREYLRGSAAFWTMFVVTAICVIDGGVMRDLRVILGGPVIAALVIFAVAYVSATNRAKSDFFASIAPGLGLTYTVSGHPAPVTPLLGAGDQRRFEHTMEGPLFGQLAGPHCLVGHYTYETGRGVDSTVIDGFVPSAVAAVGGEELRVPRSHPFTVCVIDAGGPIARFRGLYLRARLSGLGLDNDWLKRAPRPEPVELESTRFNELYDLRMMNDQDRVAVRELFSPSFVMWLNEHPLRPGFECKAGTLVVFVRGHADSEWKFTMLHEAAREISRRLGKQVEEGGSTAGLARASAR